MIKKVLLAASAVSLTIAPVAAQAQAERSTAPAKAQSELGGVSTPVLIAAIAAIGVGLYLIIDDGDDDAISD